MTVHEDLTRVIEGARDRSRKDFNVVKESYGQYLARAILASDVIAQVRAETLRDAAEEADEWKAAGGMHGGEWFPSEWAGQVAGWLEHRADRIEKETGL